VNKKYFIYLQLERKDLSAINEFYHGSVMNMNTDFLLQKNDSVLFMNHIAA